MADPNHVAADSAFDAGYEEGYADGLADGLRAGIAAEKARAARAEAERDALADWVLGADHHPGCSGTFPGHRCKCHRDDLEAILDAYVDRATGKADADG